jgi:antitoxin FitA
MKTITLTLEDKKIEQLQKKAIELGLSLDDLVVAIFDDLLSKPDDEFNNAMNYILKKNVNLYKKLA